MKVKFLLISFLFISFNSFACKCFEYSIDENIKNGLKKADIIFYGELIKIDTLNNSYTFKIFEFFKGNYKSNIISSYYNTNCDFHFNEKGLCIIYGSFNKNKTSINISAFSASQSQNFGPGFPPIPFEFDSNGKIIDKSELEMKIFNLKNENKSLQSFIYQLEKLRTYKKNQNTINDNEKQNLNYKILITSLVSNFLLLTVLIFILLKKRR